MTCAHPQSTTETVLQKGKWAELSQNEGYLRGHRECFTPGFRSELSKDQKLAAYELEGKEARGRPLPAFMDTSQHRTGSCLTEAYDPPRALAGCGLTIRGLHSQDTSHVYCQKQLSSLGMAGTTEDSCTAPTPWLPWIFHRPAAPELCLVVGYQLDPSKSL